MQVLENLKVRSKLLIGLVVSSVFILAIAVVGFYGIKAEKDNLEILYNEHVIGVTTSLEYLAKVEGSRVALVTMMSLGNAAKVAACDEYVSKKIDASAVLAAKADPSKLNPLKEKIDRETREARATLEEGINSPHFDEGMKKKYKETKETWEAFVETRDKELMPLIYAGKIEEANKIGLGIQAERYKKFTDITRRFVEDENKEMVDSMKFAEAAARGALFKMAVAAVIALIIGIAVSIAISNNIAKRLGPVTDAAEAMAEGNLGKTIKVTGSDEIGSLASSFNGMSESLKLLIGNITQASHQIASASEELSATAEQMAKGMQTQTTQTAQVASAMEEMNATVLEVAKNAQSAASYAKETSTTADTGGEVVAKTVDGMDRIAATVRDSARTIRELGKSSDQIGEIIAVIDDIADQTNLLALNAAIEAARAGEQGRGFAVVADEVRKLAERTTKATKEIATMIKTIQKETANAVDAMEVGTKEVADGVSLANQAGESLRAILDAVQKVNDMISQIATAAEEQSAAADEIATSVEGIASITKETSSSSEQTSTASHELSRMATELQRMVGQFKI